MTMRFGWMLTVSVLALAACEGPSLDGKVFRCATDDDCAAGESCDAAGCRAGGEGEGEGEGGCDADTDCAAGFFCDDDVCVDLAPLSTAPGVTTTSIAVGMSAALTSGAREEGAAYADGVRAAFTAQNALGGVKHRALNLQALNDGGNPTTAAANATALTTGATPVFALLAGGSQTVAALETAASATSRVLIVGHAGSSAVFDDFNRFLFASRPSAKTEVEQATNYFVSERDLRTPLQNFAMLVEANSDAEDAVATTFADELATHLENELLDRLPAAQTLTLQRFAYRENALDMDNAVEATLQWIAGGSVRTNESGARPVVIGLAGSGRSVAKYVEDLLNAFHEIKLGIANPAAFGLDAAATQRLQLVDDVLFWAPAEAGLDTIASQTNELGAYDTVAGDVAYCSRIVSTQAVPAALSSGTAAAYIAALTAANPTAVPSRAGFEGYIAARVLIAGLLAAPAALTTDALIDALEGLAPVDFGAGPVDFSTSSHVGPPAATFFDGTGFDEACDAVDVDLDITPQPPPSAQGCPVGVRLNDIEDICVLQGQLLGDDGAIELTNDFSYLLKGVVFVGDGSLAARLEIEPGTVVVGDFETTGTLVITRNADIIADGVLKTGAGEDQTCTSTCAVGTCVDGLCVQPIVFTSEKAVGARATGDWGGLVINGRAPLNCTKNTAFNAAEGTTSVTGACQGVGEGGTALFGGEDPDDDSGVLRFVRVEFAGKRIQDGTTGLENELNGIAFQGVGRGTTVDYVHVHRGQDDGVEFFGGTVDVKHLLVTCADDDSFDWTGGYAGRAQFVVLQQCGGIGDNGIEADNRTTIVTPTANDFIPRSRPVLANFTIIGLNDAAAVGKSKAGALIREGTNVTIANSVITGFNSDCLDIDQSATFNQAGTFDDADGFGFTAGVDGAGLRRIDFPGTLMSCASPFEVEAAEAATFGAAPVEAVFLSSNGASTAVFSATGLVSNGFAGVDSGAESRFAPTAASPLRSGVATFTDPYVVEGAFFETVTYRGAVDPAADWTVGWSASPAN